MTEGEAVTVFEAVTVGEGVRVRVEAAVGVALGVCVEVTRGNKPSGSESRFRNKKVTPKPTRRIKRAATTRIHLRGRFSPGKGVVSPFPSSFPTRFC